MWSAPAERSDDGALHSPTPQTDPNRCRATLATALHTTRTLTRPVLQRFPRDFLVVEMKNFAADDLIIFVTLARNQNQIVRAGLFDCLMYCLAAIGNFLV